MWSVDVRDTHELLKPGPGTTLVGGAAAGSGPTRRQGMRGRRADQELPRPFAASHCKAPRAETNSRMNREEPESQAEGRAPWPAFAP
jgi:hypothetical protein